MKLKIITPAVLFMLISLTAFSYDKKPHSSKEIAVNGSYQKITVGNNIKLVLIPANQKTPIKVTGEQGKLENIEIKVNRNELVISSRKNVKPGSIIVFIPASDITGIDLKNGASAYGHGDLKFKNLTVLINADSLLDLAAYGNITVKSAEDCELYYVKNYTGKVH